MDSVGSSGDWMLYRLTLDKRPSQESWDFRDRRPVQFHIFCRPVNEGQDLNGSPLRTGTKEMQRSDFRLVLLRENLMLPFLQILQWFLNYLLVMLLVFFLGCQFSAQAFAMGFNFGSDFPDPLSERLGAFPVAPDPDFP